MPGEHHVFISYNSADRPAAALVHQQLTRQGLTVFWDVGSLRAGDLWLERLQQEVDGCGAFVLLVGRDGVRRWVGAEAQAALNRFFGPHDDGRRLPIFPVLLDGSAPETLPAFLRLFQATRWDGMGPLPDRLLESIRTRAMLAAPAGPLEGCPFVGLAAYRPEQAHLFFGRQKETLDALACFETRGGRAPVRWVEINGNSGSGKSSLMNAGLLPLIGQGWLWPRTGFAQWKRIGPMMPGARPVAMLAEALARAWQVEMADVHARLVADGEAALAFWLRGRKRDEGAFLLAVDQFEELFTTADAEERRRFDVLLSTALRDGECPLFVLSTVRADFLDRFAEDLPRLVAQKNQIGKAWTLALISAAILHEVIDGPARLAGLDVSEVRELILEAARDEPGALPLVENALQWLWDKRQGNRLDGRLLREHGGLAGLLSQGADDLLASLGPQRERGLELLFALVSVDRDGSRHTQQRIGRAKAVAIAGGGDAGRAVLDRLSGHRNPDGTGALAPLRLVTVNEDGSVDLIHETLIRSKGVGADGKPQPYWRTLWDYVEQNRERAAWRERLREDVAAWVASGRASGLQWSHERVREAVGALRPVGRELDEDEQAFLGPIDPQAMLEDLLRPETDHRRRQLIGERLDVLGDPRTGVGVDADGTPLIDWCPVPGGELSIEVERRMLPGQKRLKKAVSGFRIARYPVTVSQYRAFLTATDGWRDPGWWGYDLNLADLLRFCNHPADLLRFRNHPADLLRFRNHPADLFRDPEGDSYDIGRFRNHPAVFVNWFDAVAFCRWLSRRLAATVRLPDEWEWQQAATGGDVTRVFPWPGAWDPKQEPYRANTFESHLGSATAVGMYPGGATPIGALDMAGTVLEWCVNKQDMPDVLQSRWHDFGSLASRVVRGGSWLHLRFSARAAYRNGVHPTSRDHGLGFRVVCSAAEPVSWPRPALPYIQESIRTPP